MHEQLLTAAERLEAAADTLADQIAHQITEQMPEFGSEASVTARTREAVRASITGFARMVRHGGDPEALLPAAEVLEYARVYVRRGVPMERLLRIYRLGHAALWRAWSAQLREADQAPDDLLELLDASSEALFAYMDRLTGWVIAEYAAERERWIRSASAVRAETVRAVLRGEADDTDAASRALGYELRRWHLGLVLWREGAAEAAGEAAAFDEVLDELTRTADTGRALLVPAGRSVAWAWLGSYEALEPEVVDALASSGPRSDGVSVAIGEPGESPAGFRRSHEEAMQVRRLVREAGQPPGVVLRHRRVALAALLLADLPAARRFVCDELGALGTDDEATGRLRATLLAYLEEQASPLHAAQRLGIHVNTVHNRVRRCEELLGRPVRERRLELEAALQIVSLLGPQSEEDEGAPRGAPDAK